MNTEKSKANEPQKLFPNLSQRLDLNSSNKMFFIKTCLYITLGKIMQQCKDNKLKIVTQIWNDDFELPDGYYSGSNIKDYIQYIIKKNQESLPTNLPILIYINKINNRLLLKIKDRYKSELHTMKLFGSTKKSIDKTENGENVPILEVIELVQFNLVDYQYQKSRKYYVLLHPVKLMLICYM